MEGESETTDVWFGHSIKLYAWENAFIRKVLFVRNELELKMLRKIGIATVRVHFNALCASSIDAFAVVS